MACRSRASPSRAAPRAVRLARPTRSSPPWSLPTGRWRRSSATRSAAATSSSSGPAMRRRTRQWRRRRRSCPPMASRATWATWASRRRTSSLRGSRASSAAVKRSGNAGRGTAMRRAPETATPPSTPWSPCGASSRPTTAGRSPRSPRSRSWAAARFCGCGEFPSRVTYSTLWTSSGSTALTRRRWPWVGAAMAAPPARPS
mmetsp:Transcript_3046/g.9564  ORF Transcript_3046/g.9564 Transcript_3046/m.9564 type:complete len:201 (+) Transcript_3046:923-1525(+)